MGQLASGAFDGSGTGVFSGGSDIRTVLCEYDFARHGGAQGSIVIGNLPSGSWVMGGFMNVETAPLGVGASIGITSEGAGDIVAVAAIAGAPWSTTGKKAIIPKRNTPESTSILLTEARNILFVISGADLTAGKVQLYLEVMGAR
jgi:hypothetical protein